MAAVPTIIYFGSSNCRGLGTSVLELSPIDWERYFGVPFNLSGQGSPINVPGAGFPIRGVMQGKKIWTPSLPYMVEQVRPIAVGGGGTTLDYAGEFVGAPPDSWVFIAKNSYVSGLDPGGQGNTRRVVSDTENGGGAGIHRLIVADAWLPAVRSDGEIAFWQDSHTVASATSLVVTKTTNTPEFPTPDGLKGKAVVIGGLSRRITANAEHSFTVDLSLGDTPPGAGTPIDLLLGEGAAETLAGLEQHAGASLQPPQIFLDTARVLRAGRDYTNCHLQPVGAPNDLTVNAFFELLLQFGADYPDQIYGLCMGRDSATISPYSIVHGSLFHAWQKDLRDLSFNPAVTSGMYQALTSALSSMQVLVQLENNTIDPIFVILLAENDAQPVVGKIDQIGAYMVTLRNALRTLLDKPQMPWIMVGPSSVQWLPDRDQVYTQLDEIVAQDLYSGLVDTRNGYTYLLSENPPVHFDTASQVKLGKAIYAAWGAMNDRIAAAAVPAQVDNSPSAIVARIDAALAPQGLDVLSYTVNGRQVTLHSRTELLAARKYYASLAARQSGLRRTRASFGGRR